MGEWIYLIGLLFEIFKYFKDQEREEEVRKEVSDIVESFWRAKESPLLAVWKCIEEIEGFADAFAATVLPNDFSGKVA